MLAGQHRRRMACDSQAQEIGTAHVALDGHDSWR